MDEKKIIGFVNTAVYSDKVRIHDIIDYCNEANDLLQYKIMTAYRFLFYWGKYKRNTIKKSDLEVSLRNYLLVLNTDIDLPGFNVSEDNVFGLSQNGSVISVNYNLPDYVNSEFIQKAYMNGIQYEQQESKYVLDTNPFVRNLTGFEKYKSIEQKLTVIGALNVPKGFACMVSMSTGAGKSLITQTVSYQEDTGLSIIIVPTISLMLDQHKNAKQILKGYTDNEIFYYHSNVEIAPIIEAIEKKSARMLFLSPEALLKNSMLKNIIEDSNKNGYLKNLIIDEAHIIVEWGASFRIDFQCLDSFRKMLMKNNPDLRTYLLSATYSKETAKQIRQFYSEPGKWIELRCDKLRSELHFDIIKASSKSDKYRKMLELISVLPRPIIVYVDSPDEAEYTKNVLRKNGFSNLYTFTGNTNNNSRDNLIKKWSENDFDIMIATCAFGVGVDKKDVRTVLHLYIPENPNKYYQEAGRGGRDGFPCLSVILYNQDDVSSARGMTQKVLTVEKIIGRWFSMLNSTKAVKKRDEIIIDTSVKPSYNETDTYIDFLNASEIDVSWNVYVILLLRRKGLVDINNVYYQNGTYLFSLSIINRILLNEDYEMEELITEIREDEVRFVTREFKLMENALKSVGKECWSEMFNSEYNLTDEYCSGCNFHKKIIDEKTTDFPLKRGIHDSYGSVSETIRRISDKSRNLIIQYETDVDDIIEYLLNQNIKSVIIPDGYNLDYSKINSEVSSCLNIMNYSEFMMHSRKNNVYYIDGASAIVYDENDPDNINIINAVKNISSSVNESCFVHLIKTDFKIRKYDKYFSELIDGPLKSDYILGRK